MTDTAFFRKHGFQIFRDVLPLDAVSAVHDFMDAEKEKALAFIRERTGISDPKALVTATKDLLLDRETDLDLARVLRGEYHLSIRLNPIFQTLARQPSMLALMRDVLRGDILRMHMPPMVRFILPQNDQAAVPPHHDIIFNGHLDDFVTVWVPLTATDDACAGVGIYEGLFEDPGIDAYNPRRSWAEILPVKGITPSHFPMQPGDVLVMRKDIVHCSMLNTADRVRYSIDFRFFAAPSRSSKHYLDLVSGDVIPPAEPTHEETYHVRSI